MRAAPLPPQWACLEGKVQYVQQVSPKEYACSCPKCSDLGHVGHDWPDRCRLFVDDHPTLFCRKCGLIGFPDQFGDSNFARPSAAEMEKWRADREASEEARKRSAERALEHLRSNKIWESYYDAMDATARAYWRSRGIPDSWQASWWFGWRHAYRVCGDDGCWQDTPAATIPLFDQQGDFLNLKYRIVHPPSGVGKYRYELAGQKQPPFLCNPTCTSSEAIVVEGELKAAVTFITLDTANIHVIGLPGTNPAPEIVTDLAKFDRVTLIMDPGAEAAARKLRPQIGLKKCRVLIPPAKIDDAILMGLTAYELRIWLKQAQEI
jgi:hypothetical protein